MCIHVRVHACVHELIPPCVCICKYTYELYIQKEKQDSQPKLDVTESKTK